ncbi:hypothetical protein KC19_3G073800 [Ceratodon purpureus]|uniref:Uncharacterized protein n=1 Tax=Ceratodon purpureus TaxID=3225 RepID=A0A8T0IJJ9_CERPU|nr:hypothetical protein KC19_3G073800 [Ceratodon purpureus]
MGALTVALGLPGLHSQWNKVSIRRIPRVSGGAGPKFLYPHSHSWVGSSFRHYHQLRRLEQRQLLCAASASWPYESWATGEGKEDSRRPGFLEQEGGVEVLAMGLGVVVSVVLAVSRHSTPGVPVGVLSLAFLTAVSITLRHQIAALCGVLVSQVNSIQAAMAVHLSSMRNNVIIWGTGNGASVHSPTAPIRDVEATPSVTRDSFEKRQEENSIEEAKGLSSTEIEAALTNIAKSVAQLTMVVASLDSKISSLEKAAASNVSRSENNRIVEDATTSYAFTEAEPKQNGIYRIQNSVVNGNDAQLKWEEAVVKVKNKNEATSQGIEGYKPSEASLASNRAFPEYESRARGEQVSLLESSPVDILPEVGSSRKNLKQSAPLKFSKTETGDTSMELFFQDVGVREPQGDVVSAGEDLTQSNQDVAAVESMELFFQDAGVSSSQPDGGNLVQSRKNNVVESVAQPQVVNPTLASSVPSGVLDDVVRNKAAQGRERVYNEVDAEREENSSRRASRSGGYELDGSENYRAVPTTVGYRGDGNQRTGAKPDVLRLKRIMSGAESRYTDGVKPNSQPNSWIQNDAMASGMTQSKVMSKEQPTVVFATQSDAGWDESSVSRSTGNGWADEDGRASDRVGAGRGSTRSQGVKDESSYDGQGQSSRRRPRPEGSEELSSSGEADYGQRWRREGSSGGTNADFGGNGSSSESNEGGNGSKRRQSSSRRSYDSDEDRDVESPTSQDRRPSPASPSYPSERTETFRNLPEPKSSKPDDEGFQKILDEVEALLKEGREGLEGRIEVGVAERMLYEAAELCEKAVELRPSSLVAVGMWGNTLLLHGELKLRLSQNLRSMMPEPPSKSMNRREYREVEEEIMNYEATLQDVGEECEQLLVEAGRKYRLALSMDRTDMRALYNWGLALCYRGQLIAEEGGETAAQDADKVFLAAIDKFEAMMGLSDMYAAGALLNWGLAMRDRSRLRPLGSKERQRIMAQAKEIFEEALRLDPNYGQARGAVAASIVELKGLQEYEQEPQESKESPPSRGFRDWWG